VKYDGFRSLAYIVNGSCKLVSRNEYDYKRFADLPDSDEINAKDAILDGELVMLDSSGKAQFYDLMTALSTQVPFKPLDIRRPHSGPRQCVIRADLQKWIWKELSASPPSVHRTINGKTTWIKVKNPNYSQAEGRRELFNKRRS